MIVRKRVISILLVLIVSSLQVFSQEESNIDVEKITDNIYRLTSKVPYSVNFLAYVHEEGILLVDAGQKQTGEELKTVLNELAIGNKKVKYLINSHAHIDHTGGNFALAGEPIIIGSDLLKSTLQSYSYVLYEFPDNALPQISFADSMKLLFGDEEIRLISTPGSHDMTDIMIHLVKSKIVYMGDISYGMWLPSIDAYTGNLLKYPEVIERILHLIPKDVTIVSGHGPDCSHDELKKFSEMIASTAAIVQKEMKNGKDVKTMQEEDILKEWATSYGGDLEEKRYRNYWISKLANGGPSKFFGSLAEELYNVLIHNDAEAAITHYYKLKTNHPDNYPFGPSLVSRTGHWLLSKNRIEDAIKIFELNIKEFNDYWRVYDDLGEAYMKDGNKKLAIKNYEKSLELNPRNKNAEEILMQLKGKE